MDTYRYKALSSDGAPVAGVVEAFDEMDAVNKIKQTCPIVTKIQKVEEREGLGGRSILPNRKISDKQLAMMCSQFGIILTSGLPIVRAVELIAGQAEDKTVRKLLFAVSQDVAKGHGLAQSFELEGKGRLPTTFIETVRAGEEAGTLDTSFSRLYKYYDKSAKVRAKVGATMAYPIFLMVVAVVVIIIIMTVAVPMFTRMFSGMGAELPLPTKILIGVSDFFSKYVLFVVIGIALLVLFCKIWGNTERGRLFFAKLRLKLPVIGKIARLKASGQFANTMSTLLTAGLPMLRAVAITGKVMDNYMLGCLVGAAAGGIEEGRRMGDCIRRAEMFPELLVEMTAVGEETGELESTLDVVGAYYDSEVELATQKALSMMEPIIICVLAVVVVFILLAVYLPMFGMYGGIG